MTYQKPYTFRAGNYAKAKEVNANFDTLKDYVNDLTQTLSSIQIESTPYNKANKQGNKNIIFYAADAPTSGEDSAYAVINNGTMSSAIVSATSTINTNISNLSSTVGNINTRVGNLETASNAPNYTTSLTPESGDNVFATGGVLWLQNVPYSYYTITLGSTTFSLLGSQGYTFPVASGTSYNLGDAYLYADFFPNAS